MTLAARLSALAEAVRDKLNLMTPRLLPSGGTAGQALVKTGSGDYETEWADQSGGAGGGASLGKSQAYKIAGF